MIQRSAIWSYMTTGSPSPLLSQTPPNPLQTVEIPDGPSKEPPVVLSKTWKPSLTICTYWVAPTSPSVSGGAQLQAPPGKKTPSKLSSGVGMLRPAKAISEFAPWTTGSWLSLWFSEAGIFGFSLASRSNFEPAGACFISRSGGEVSLRTDVPTMTSPPFLFWMAGGVKTVETDKFFSASTLGRLASMMRGSAITVVSNTAAEIKLIAIVRVFISCPPVQHQIHSQKEIQGWVRPTRARHGPIIVRFVLT